MLRDDAQVAMNEVLLQAAHVAQRYRDTAPLCDAAGEGVAAPLNRLAGEREALAEQLRYQLRAMQDLPDAADVERDALQAMGERLAARLRTGGVGAVLREREHDEERLAALATDALAQPVPGDARALLEHVRRSAREAVRALAALRARL